MSENLLETVRLDVLMELTEGRDEIIVAVLDGPVATTHPGFGRSTIRVSRGSATGGSDNTNSAACRHGTFVAGLLSTERDWRISGVCPGCTLLVCPIYSDAEDSDDLSGATPEVLARAIVECMDAGARVLNVSGAILSSAIAANEYLQNALGEASRRGVLVVAAAGNQASVGRSAITGHPWVLAVVGYGRNGRPLDGANLGRSIGRYGVGAPGEDITSLDPAGGTATMSGSSFAAPFVSGAAALLWSLVPSASAQEIRAALADPLGHPRKTIIPPLFDAWAAVESLMGQHRRRKAYG